MKKFIALLMVVVLTLALTVGCGKEEKTTVGSVAKETQAETKEEAKEET